MLLRFVAALAFFLEAADGAAREFPVSVRD